MKTFLVIIAVLATLAFAEGAGFGLGEKIECLRNLEKYEPRIYENSIKELIESLREKARVGIPEKNIPPMDPLLMKDTRLQMNSKLLRVDWNMTGTITGFLGFEVTKITFSLAGLKFTFGFRFPEIDGKGIYDINGVLAQLLPVYGGGSFDTNAKGLEINGKGKIGVRTVDGNQTLFLEQFELLPSLESFQFNCKGLMDDEAVSLIISRMFSDSLPDLIENYQKVISDQVSAQVTAIADKALEGLTVNDIINAIKPKPKPNAYTIHCGDY